MTSAPATAASDTPTRTWSTRRTAALLWAGVFIVYLSAMPAPRPGSVSVDVRSNELTSWALGTTGTPFADDFADLNKRELNGVMLFLGENEDGHTFVPYPPGAPLLAAPLYFFVGDDIGRTPHTLLNVVTGEILSADVPDLPHWPGTVVGSATTASAIVFLFLTIDPLVGRRKAILASIVGAFGTGAFSVAADALWQHGPAMMFLSLAGLLLSKERLAFGGLALAGAVICRPQTAIVAAVVGIWLGIAKRSIRPFAVIGLTSGIGAAVYVAYTRLVFGGFIRSGWVTNAVTRPLTELPGDLLRVLVDPRRGVLVLSPIVILGIAGIPRAWRAIPPALRGMAVGAAVLFVAQFRGQVFWDGGDGFFGYRYPLESLAASAPLLAVGAVQLVVDRTVSRRGARVLSSVSILLHTVGAYAVSAVAALVA